MNGDVAVGVAGGGGAGGVALKEVPANVTFPPTPESPSTMPIDYSQTNGGGTTLEAQVLFPQPTAPPPAVAPAPSTPTTAESPTQTVVGEYMDGRRCCWIEV